MAGWWRAAVAATTMALAAGCATGAARPGAIAFDAPTFDDGVALETVAAMDIGQTVRLRFAWPDGLVGRCRARQSVADAGGRTQARDVTFRVTVARTADAVRVVTDEVEGDALATEEGLPARLVEIVEPDGRYRAAADAPYEVHERLAQTWKLLVGAWAGRELPLGASYAATAPEPAPGGESIRVRIVIQADGRVPCRRTDTVRRCVRLRLHSQPEDPAPDALVPTLVAALLPGEGVEPDTVVASTASIATNALVVAEPDTLIPHRFVLRRRLALVGGAPGKPVIERERREELTRVCDWR